MNYNERRRIRYKNDSVYKGYCKKRCDSYRKHNREDLLMKKRLSYSINKSEVNARKRLRYKEDKKFRELCAGRVRNYYERNKERIIKRRGAYQQERYRRLKLLVFSHYCKGVIKCGCCGESEIDFLTLDHTDNDGAKHRGSLGCGSGFRFYGYLKNNNYPQKPRLTILCFNCNMAKAHHGICPHKRKK